MEALIAMGKYKKLAGNSVVFAAGNLGSKMISFILVPLYTYYLTTTEYGIVDLVTTTTSLLLPIVSGGIAVAVLRFTLDKNANKSIVVSNSAVISLIGIVLSFALYVALSFFNVLENALIYFVLLLSLQILTQILAQFARGNGQAKVFAFNGMLKTAVIGVTNILFLVNFHMGLQGYLLALVVAEIVSLIYLLITTPYFSYLKLSAVDFTYMKDMLIFSLPTIPNDVLWWFVNSSSRYFILFFLGAGANGLYAVANKIPSLISMIQSVFSQAWQISLVEEKDSKNKHEFHGQIFKVYSFLLFTVASGILVFLKFFTANLVAKAYYDSWQVTPLLLLSAIYSGFIGFYGQFYVAEKKTKGLMNTSIISGILSIICNYIFISAFGLMGIGIASAISLFAGWMVRIYDTRSFVHIKIDWSRLIGNHMILLIQFILLFLVDAGLLMVIEFIMFIALMFFNKDIVSNFIEQFIKIIKRKK
ncbi:lipopolysaccharide biosynthesis protein [Enterococcus faecalis]|uniref:lipopolysaccharide biosynthesis protein n=1 Tax=Enterococcus faecalis TaxID=1351 RepID=UPI0039196FEC